MKHLKNALVRTTPGLFYCLYISAVLMTLWVINRNWTGVQLLDVVSAFSGIIGAVITVAGAYWIANKSLIPVLAQRRTEQQQEWILRAKEAASSFVGITRALQSVGTSTEFVFARQQGGGVGHLFVPNYQLYIQNLYPKFKEGHHELQNTVLVLRSFAIYDDTSPGLRRARSVCLKRANRFGQKFTDIEELVAHAAGGRLTQSQAAPRLVRAINDLYAHYNKLATCQKIYCTRLNAEQERLEREITTPSEH